MSIRYVVLVAHRWLGLSTAMVLSIVAATGAVLAWPGSFPLRSFAGLLHAELGMGPVGHEMVIGSTVVAMVVLLSGLFLWWKRKLVAVRTGAGWRRTLFDFHHSLGVFGFLFMLMLAVTAMAMLGPAPEGGLRLLMVDLHTARRYSLPIRLLYTLGTMALAVQSVTGLLMWWTRARKTQ